MKVCNGSKPVTTFHQCLCRLGSINRVKVFVNIRSIIYRNKNSRLFVYLKDLINKEVLTIGIRAYGFNRFKRGRSGVCSKVEKETEVRFLVVAVRKKETEETIILICGSKKSKAESRIT